MQAGHFISASFHADTGSSHLAEFSVESRLFKAAVHRQWNDQQLRRMSQMKKCCHQIATDLPTSVMTTSLGQVDKVTVKVTSLSGNLVTEALRYC